MGKLFLSMLIGVIVMLVLNDESPAGWRESLSATASAVTEALRP